jgi:hypothetical protein
MEYSPLEKERIQRGWSRAYIEAIYRIPAPSLERWEKGKSQPGQTMRDLLCRIYGKTPEELDIVKRGNIVAMEVRNTQKESSTMSEVIRRAALEHFGSLFNSIVDRWPKSNYHYEELQTEVSRVIAQQSIVAVEEDKTSLMSRRTAIGHAIKGVALLPMQLTAGIALVAPDLTKKVDTDTLLKHLAAGVAACWYLSRGTELSFTSSLISEYIRILTPLALSRSEVHRKASAGLLSQSFMLKGSLTKDITGDHQATELAEQAVQHGIIADNPLIQAIAHRMMCNFYYPQENYAESVRSAERAASLINGNMDKGVQSFIYAGLASSQSADRKSDQALASLKKACDLFDPTRPLPIHVRFSEGTLSFESGLVHRDLGHWAAAASDFDQAITSCVSTVGKIQNSIERAKVEACRDDRSKDMDLTVRLWKQGMSDAKALGSERFVKEARKAYLLLVAAWSNETAIKELREHL